MSLSTQVLDTTTGEPASGMAVSLWQSVAIEGEAPAEGAWTLVTEGRTNEDGRIDAWPVWEEVYRLVFATGPWWAERGMPALYPEVVVTFAVTDRATHYHVPLLAGPFAYTTYRER
ncbi:hydroxyisourate hydrolase [Actinopolymorpha alba]|uniref:hydroxyisourate hydrolase n=1 Tax=Actinopolymorpha alba TaxID=533267 RepID=UPI0003A95DF5|nr:hydroxyisourate hydrolase [Actinopolymorpha alba]